MAWLIINEDMTPEAAQQRLSSVRSVRSALHTQPAIKEFYARRGAWSLPPSEETC